MTSPQENKLSMYLTVKTVCDAATAIWTPLVAFAANVLRQPRSFAALAG